MDPLHQSTNWPSRQGTACTIRKRKKINELVLDMNYPVSKSVQLMGVGLIRRRVRSRVGQENSKNELVIILNSRVEDDLWRNYRESL